MLDKKNLACLVGLILLSACNEDSMLNIDPSAEIAANTICKGTTINDVAGTADCSDGPGADLLPENICSSKVIFGQSGSAFCSTSTTSSVTDIGDPSSSTLTVTPATGESLISVTVDLGADFTPANICNGKTIFGRAGTSSCNLSYPDLVFSTATRADNATFNPSSPVGRTQATLADELANNSNFTTSNTRTPVITVPGDGGVDFETAKGGRPTKVCGLSGTNADRIADCLAQNTTRAIWESLKYGYAGESDWKLVTVYSTAMGAASGDLCAGSCNEVWRDERTQLIWSMPIGATDWTSAGTDCQSNTGAALIGKGNMVGASRGWRLPTRSDWMIAIVDGAAAVLPSRGGTFWTASPNLANAGTAWDVNGILGQIKFSTIGTGRNVRCVGH